MQQSPSWEANSSSASQEIPRILWNPKVHYRFHKRWPPVHILSQGKPVHAASSPSWRYFLILSSHLRLGLPSALLPSSLPIKILYTSLFFIYATSPAHRVLLDLITRKLLGEEYRSLSSSLCSLLHSPVISSLSTLNLRSFLSVSDQVSHPYKTTDKITVLYILVLIFLDSKLEDKKISTVW